MSATRASQPFAFRGARRAALAVAVPCAILLAFGAFTTPTEFFRAYLVAYVFWISITLGCLVLLMLHHLAGGAWGMVLRRILEAGTQTSPLMVVLLLPLVFGVQTLYPWARPEVVASSEVLQHKSLYLNVPFFLARTLIYIAVWNGLIYLFNHWSAEQERTANPALASRLRRVSAPALAVFGLTVTFAAIDYLMSLEPAWYSTIYSAMVAVGGMLAAFAFAIFVLALLHRHAPFASAISSQVLNDLGNLLIAFVMIWAYLSYSQFLIIWSGNLSDDITWYLRRLRGGWEWVALVTVLTNFALPFILLLSPSLKRDGRVLGFIAGWVLVGGWVNTLWLVKPAFEMGFSLHWLDLVATLGVGVLWLWVFARQLEKRSLLPLHDPRAATLLVGKEVVGSEAG